MSVTQTRQSIRQRLRSEAARQWGIDETDLESGSFDPLVDLLFGAFAVEMEKLWQEMEASRGRIVKRMVETILPDVITGITPAHSVITLSYTGVDDVITPSDQFSCQLGNRTITLSPAGTYRLDRASVRIIASGDRIDIITNECNRQQLARLQSGRQFDPNVCWVGLELADNIESDTITFFTSWPSVAEQTRYAPYISLIRYYGSNDQGKTVFPLAFIHGIEAELHEAGPFAVREQATRDFYHQHFNTIQSAGVLDANNARPYPTEWEPLLDDQGRSVLSLGLVWIKMVCPASVPSGALDNLLVLSNCVPVLNRKLVHQRGRLQAIFNVYALKDDDGFLTIEKVLNGDGEELKPVDNKTRLRNTYSLRRRNVARFDQRDAFELLSEVNARLRDDLAAFDALDNSVLSSHLDQVNRGIQKMSEHLSTFDHELPQIYLMVNTRSAGNIIDIYFWTCSGSKGNGLPAMSRLRAEPAPNRKFENALLLLPTTGGSDVPDDATMRHAFGQSIQTRGTAVTVDDFRRIARNLTGLAASDVQVHKKIDLGAPLKEGIRKVIEVILVPDLDMKLDEEYWMRQAREVKNELEHCSTGLFPLFVSVQGYSWKI